jgi:hypothetical protein
MVEEEASAETWSKSLATSVKLGSRITFFTPEVRHDSGVFLALLHPVLG